jgi:PAS domain S-box-containing protein
VIANDEMYRRIVEAVPEGIWVVDAQGRTIFSNQRMAEILGTDLESLYSWSCFDSVYPADLTEAQSHFARTFSGDRRPFDFRLRRADGSPVWVSICCQPVYDSAGVTVGLLGLFSDISERKRSEAVLRESEERFRNMANTAPVLIWVCGPDRRCTFFNKGWLDFTGRTMEQELGSGWMEGLRADDFEPTVAKLSAAFESRNSFQLEKRLRRADGEYRSVLCTAVPRFEEGGAFAGYVGCGVDITDLKRSQEQMLATQKLKSLSVLAGGVAHDFNNLLGSILADSELLLPDLPPGSSARDGIERIRSVAVRASEVVRELMAYAGQENTVFEPVDFSRLVREMLHLIKPSISKRAVLKVNLAGDLPSVAANATQMRQVLMNLVTNASEALGDSEGEISVTLTRVRAERGMAVPDLPPGDYVRLEVSDTGCGMSEDVQARIFDPFFTTKFAGRGLGLAAAHGIVRAHGGAITVVSAPGRGSTFGILLPGSGEVVTEAADIRVHEFQNNVLAEPGADPLYPEATILMVEDEDNLRLAVSKMLRKNGFHVLEAGDGKAAVELFRTNAREIDVVLLDLTLPGLSGREVLRELRNIRPTTKVILTTAYSEHTALTSLGDQEPSVYIRKPYRLRDLIHLVRRLTATSNARGRSAGRPGV